MFVVGCCCRLRRIATRSRAWGRNRIEYATTRSSVYWVGRKLRLRPSLRGLCLFLIRSSFRSFDYYYYYHHHHYQATSFSFFLLFPFPLLCPCRLWLSRRSRFRSVRGSRSLHWRRRTSGRPGGATENVSSTTLKFVAPERPGGGAKWRDVGLCAFLPQCAMCPVLCQNAGGRCVLLSRGETCGGGQSL